ncbi:hypothetical protein C3N85_21995 [Salmonella enterica subsp. enterica serovar Morehead]|nr:hypothetical protein [Salmonella enterica subsp. enterica serovar Kottbus]EEM2539468.1 hypothetical protein [Salmonella enterica subsp. enterica serovar Morehead]EHN5889120.1 hypothetical protein [Salmonella enterica subsp. enterica serovar Newport]
MDFITSYHKFRNSPDGTDSYVELGHDMTTLINEDQQNAVIYFTLRGFAHSYVLLYEDQAVTTDFAGRAKKEMQTYLDIILTAFNNISHPETLWGILNKVIITYEHSKKIF